MSRIRTIKPEIWLSEDYQNLSPAGRLAFVYMITNADDYGRLRTSAAHLARNAVGGAVAAEMDEQLALMTAQGMTSVYTVANANYVQLIHWAEHQRVSHPRESVLPPPPAGKRRRIPENSGGRTKIIDVPTELPNELSMKQAVQEVYEAWLTAGGWTAAQRDLTDQRREKIQTRLKHFPLADVVDAARGWLNDPWPDRVNQSDLTILLRSDEQCEKFRDLYRVGPASNGKREMTVEEKNAEYNEAAIQEGWTTRAPV